jgi:hypothetical protein
MLCDVFCIFNVCEHFGKWKLCVAFINILLLDFEVQNEIRITTPGLTCKENDVINFVLETNNDFGYFVQILNDEVTTYSNVVSR